MNDNQEVMQKIIEYSKDFYSKLDFAHNIDHGERVAKVAMMIAEKEGGDLFLIQAGAWLHQFHDNVNLAEKFLNLLDINEIVKENLLHIIKQCRPNKIRENDSLEAKIVFDADSLDLIGVFGTIRELSCNLKVREMAWGQSVIKTREVQDMFKNKLMTETAKLIMKEEFELLNDFWKVYDKWEQL